MTKRNARSGFRAGRNQDALQENIELLTGQRGSGLERAITVRELAQLGLIGVSRGSAGNVVTKPIPPTGDSGGGDIPVQLPHAPSGFMAYGGFGSIMLEWQLPTFSGFAHAEVWRAAPNVDGSAPNLEQAVLVATTPATVFGDIVDPGSTFYYWCRFVNIRNTAGPYNALDGTLVKTSPNISDIIDDIGSQMQDSELIQGLNESIEGVDAGVKSNSSAISTINKDGSEAYKAMWSTKAQAGDIKAGIGILAKSDGTSQVAVAASQFVVFDPNSPGKLTPTFAIDNGNVVIPKALIQSATIQILNAQHIVADSVVAGVGISSPTITGGRINGSEINIGAGGWYNHHHFHVNSSGHLYAQSATIYGTVHASSGSFTGTVNANAGTFNNVTINENCNVKGTVYANRIVGDIASTKILNVGKLTSNADNTWKRVVRITWKSSTISRTLFCYSIDFVGRIRALVDGRQIAEMSMPTSDPFGVFSFAHSVGTGSGTLDIELVGFSGATGMRTSYIKQQMLVFNLARYGSDFN